MLDMHPLLLTSETAPGWLAVAYYAFWAGLPALFRWLLNVRGEPTQGLSPPVRSRTGADQPAGGVSG